VTKIHEDLMRMEDKEIKFWVKVDKLPNNMEQDEWEVILLITTSVYV
jgi:hypothetical protein